MPLTSTIYEDFHRAILQELPLFCVAPMQDKIFNEFSPFGPDNWREFSNFNVEYTEPPEVLTRVGENLCPFFPRHHIKQTHILCCIPKGLSVEKLWGFVCKNTPILDAIYKQENQKTYWCWVAKKPILTSYHFTYQAYQLNELLYDAGSCSGKLNPLQYDAPSCLEVMVAIYAAQHLENVTLFPDEEQATNYRVGLNDVDYSVIGGDDSNTFCFYTRSCQFPGIASVLRSVVLDD